MIAYRADIDGLRALAVALVILFHAKLGLFPGGFKIPPLSASSPLSNGIAPGKHK